MTHTRRANRFFALLSTVTLVACTAELTDPGATGDPGATASTDDPAATLDVVSDQEALEVALEASEMLELGTSLGNFLGGSLSPSGLAGLGAGSASGNVPYDLTAPADCTFSQDISWGNVTIAGSCVTEDGDRIEGSFSLVTGAGAGCAGFSVEIAHSFSVIRANGDRFEVDGTLRFQFGVQHTFAVDFNVLAVDADGHSFEHNVNACLFHDLAAGLRAGNGKMVTRLDGELIHAVAIEDLQKRFCELLPFHGLVRFQRGAQVIETTFSRAASGNIVVTVSVDGAVVETREAEHATTGLCQGTAPAPLAMDYATCGGCELPPPSDPTDPPDAPEPQDPPQDDGGDDDGGDDDGGDDDGSDDGIIQ